MELRTSDKYIGKYVIADLTPEAERYVSDISVDYHPFGKIENHACIVDVPVVKGFVKFMAQMERLMEYGLSLAEGAAVAYEYWRRAAQMERLSAEHYVKARQMNRILAEGCAACKEFARSHFGDDELGFCRYCDRELAGVGRYGSDPDTGLWGFVTRYVPEQDCKYFGGGK